MSLSALYWALYESIVLCRTTKGEYLDASRALLRHSNIYHFILLHPHVTPKYGKVTEEVYAPCQNCRTDTVLNKA
jgi:hypothetical protein